MARTTRLVDLTGRTFGLLTVLERSECRDRSSRAYWWCHCACGGYKAVRGDNLRAHRTKTCGCRGRW